MGIDYDYKAELIGKSCELVGYPVDGDKEGYQYSSIGKITDVIKKAGGGVVVYYDAVVTAGMSGAPIYVTDEGFIKMILDKLGKEFQAANAQVHFKKILIGFHNDTNAAKGGSFGTVLTPTIFQWAFAELSFRNFWKNTGTR